MPTDEACGIVVVIGGGNGIGAACCRLMSKRGWIVVCADKDLSAAQAIAAETGGHGLEVDVRDADALDRLAANIETSLGPIKALVVSSGTFQDNVPLAQTPRDALERLLSVNFAGTYNANRAFGPRIAASGGGAIVNLSSVTGHSSTPLNIYGPTKAAIINMTKSFAGEWGRSGVRVNSVSPGITLVPRVIERRRSGVRYPTNLDDQMALGRCVEPQEVAEAVEFLSSIRASAITGTDLIVDCGWMTASLWTSYGGVRAP